MKNFTSVCPNCGAKYQNTPKSLAGKGVVCRKCKKKFMVRLIGESTPSKSGPAPTRPSQRLNLSSETNEWTIGETILDLYKVTGFLGQGGMGRVYKVRHLDWGVDLAVKTPLAELLAGSKGAENFERESETWVNLGLHPHTISCYYVRRVNGVPSVFAEYAAGGSLHDWIRDEAGRPGRLYKGGVVKALARIIDIGIQFAWGLKFAHEQGLIHLDVKPANVMMTPGGLAKVTDFGLAMAASRGSLKENAIAPDGQAPQEAGSAPGTPQYFSPEQAEGRKLTRQTDIWSWGLCLLEMFRGGRTWEMGTVAEAILEDHISSGYSEKWLPAMPGPLADLLRDCFRKNPDERPQNIGEAADRLIAYFKTTFQKDYPRIEPKNEVATADALNNRAVSLRDLGRSAEAQGLWESALQTHPNHLESSYNLGLVQWRAGRLTDDGLMNKLTEAQRSQPDNSLAPEAMANVNLERGAFRDALKILKESGSPSLKTIAKEAKAKLRNSNRLLWSADVPEGGGAAVLITNDHKTAVTGGDDQKLRIWDLQSGRLLRSLDAPSGIRTLASSQDGGLIISGGGDFSTKDFRIAVWDLKQGSIINFLEGHQKGVGAVDIDPDGRIAASAGDDRVIIIWDLKEGKKLTALSNNKGAVLSVRLALDGKKAVTGEADGVIRIWDVNRGRVLGTLTGHQGLVSSLSLSPDGRYLLSGSSDRTVKYWDLSSRQLQKTLIGHHDEVSAVRLFPQGRFALSAGLDKTLRLWNLDTGRCLRTFEGHESWVRSMDLSPDGKVALTGSLDRTLKLWQVDPEGETHKAPMLISMVSSSELTHTAGNKYESSLMQAKSALKKKAYNLAAQKIQEARSQPGFTRGAEALTLWAGLYRIMPKTGFAGGWEDRTLTGSQADVEALGLNRAGDRLISGASDKTAAIWNPKTGEKLAELKDHGSDVKTVCFSPDGALALTGGGDCKIRLWNSTSAELTTVLEFSEKRILTAAFSPDGRFIFAGGEDCKIHIRDLSGQAETAVLSGSRTPINSLAASPDGRYLVSASGDFTNDDNLIRVWDISTRQIVTTMVGHERSINSISLIPGRRQVLSGSSDGSFRIWDLDSGKEVKVIQSGRGAIQSLCVSGDGRYFLAGFFDHSVGLWEIDTDKPLRVFQGHTAPTTATVLSGDARMAVSSGRDGLIKVWALDWLLKSPPENPWDEAARPWLQDFISLYSTEESARPEYETKDFEALLHTLGDASFGWISGDVIRREIEKMTGSYVDPSSDEDLLDDPPDPDQVFMEPEAAPPKKRSWLARLFRRNKG